MIRAAISDINNEGEGVVRAGDERFVLFVPDALPGEETDIRIVSKKKSYGTGKAVRRLSDSPERRSPKCALFGRCGGCQLQHISPEAQLRMKEETVRNALARIGGIESPSVASCLPSPELWGYRNKASVPVQSFRSDPLLAGFYKKRSHEIIPFASCPVLHPKINVMLAELLEKLRQSGFRGIKEGRPFNGADFIRHVVVRQSAFTEDSLCAVIGSRPLTGPEERTLRAAAASVCGLGGLVYNINASSGNFIWGNKTIPVYGKDTMTERLRKYTFTFESSSFFQVNSAQALALYSHASKLALADAPEKILELYSGVGSMTVFLASGGAAVTAVESWLPAAKYIQTNAEQNGISTITHRAAQAEDIAGELSRENYDVVVVDPPRTGCDEKVIDAIAKIAPKRLVYVSCNPATLARDAARLISKGYTFNEARPFDMFPETGHVETVALLSRVK